MHVESLSCNRCGAPLEVPDTANYLKCNHCGAQLAVRRNASATFTETIEQLTETTENLTEQVSKLTRQNELEALDRQWQHDRESFMVADKHGRKRLPTEGMALMGGVASTVIGGLWTILAIGITSSAPNEGPFAIAKVVFPLFGLGFIGLGIAMAAYSHRQAKDYRAAHRRYRQQRAELLKRDDS